MIVGREVKLIYLFTVMIHIDQITVKEENHAELMLCVLTLITPPIYIVLILIVRLIHCYDVLIFIIILLGIGTT